MKLSAAVLALLIVGTKSVLCQDNASTDPLPNRLFIMPTGNILPSGAVTLSSVDLAVVSAAYSPRDYLQLNLSSILPFISWADMHSGDNVLEALDWSLGTKLRVIENVGFVQAVACGADIAHVGRKNSGLIFEDYSPPDYYYSPWFDEMLGLDMVRTSPWVGSVNVALSVGVDWVSGHANIGKVFYSWDDTYSSTHTSILPSYMQLGTACTVIASKRIGVSIMAESFSTSSTSGREMTLKFVLAGFRFSIRSFVLDVAWPIEIESDFLKRATIDYPFFSFNGSM